MPDPNPTVGEIFKAKAVTDDEVNAAVEVYMSNAETGAHSIAEGSKASTSRRPLLGTAGRARWSAILRAGPTSNVARS